MTTSARRPRLTLGKLALALLLGLSLAAYVYHTLARPDAGGVKTQLHTLERGATTRSETPKRAENGMTAEEEAGARNMFNIVDGIDRANARKIGPLSDSAKAELRDPVARARLAADLQAAGGVAGSSQPDPGARKP